MFQFDVDAQLSREVGPNNARRRTNIQSFEPCSRALTEVDILPDDGDEKIEMFSAQIKAVN